MVSAYPLTRFSRSSPRGLLVVLLMMSVSGMATAECDSPSESNLAQSPILRVGEITVERQNVFSEEEADWWPYALANRLHIITRDSVIRNQLLIKTGDRLDKRRVAESERLLRRKEYLSDATVFIGMDSACEGVVDLKVVTEDQWSLTPHLSLSSSGGQTLWGIGITERNLLGQGLALRLRRDENLDRSANQLGLSSDHLLGSRYAGSLWLSDNDDGKDLSGSIGHPFYALDTETSWRFAVQDRRWRQAQFALGERILDRAVESQSLSASWGWLNDIRGDAATRWYLGAHFSEQARSDDSEVDTPLKSVFDRRYGVGYLGYERVEDRYLKTSEVDLIGLTEDIPIGLNYALFAGYVAGRNALSHRFWWKGQFSLSPIGSEAQLMQLRMTTEGMTGGDEVPSEFDLSASARWLWKRGHGVSYQMKGELKRAVQPFLGYQAYLGAHTGMKGFKDRIVSGRTSMRWTLERRVVTDLDLFDVARLGWTTYFDVGRVWDPQFPTELTDDWLANVGLGLRIVPIKVEKGKAIHVDFSVPLKHRQLDSVSDFEVSIAVREGI
jgi:hypothetical protein